MSTEQKANKNEKKYQSHLTLTRKMCLKTIANTLLIITSRIQGQPLTNRQLKNHKQIHISELNNTYLQKPKEANTLFKCNSYPYTTGNQKIWKLHLLSHNFSESEILEKLPPSLKDLTFNSEEDFSKDLDVFLSSMLNSGE